MISILEFERRALDGPVMKAMEFDVAFSKKVRELVAHYEIERDPEAVVADDETADKIFEAGVELLAGVGLYHLDTQRVIQLEVDEIRTIAREYFEHPPEAVFGRGAEEVRVRYRDHEDPRPPILAAGPAGEIEQAEFVPYVQSFVQEPSVKALGIAGGITAVDGIVPQAGTPSEMYCAQWECRQLLDILRRMDRTDMHLGLLCTASSNAAIMACMQPGLREPHNTQIGIHIMPEQKVDWNRFLLAKYCQDTGITPWTSCVSVMGGLCRKGPDVAVGLIANLLGQLSYGRGTLASLFVNRMNGTWGDAETQWATSGAARASERNIRVAIAGVCVANMEMGRTVAGFCQAVAISISNTANGFSYAWVAGGCGREARLIGEAMNVTAGMKREDADELIKRIFARAEQLAPEVPPELEFSNIYDLKTVEPKQGFLDDLSRAKEELADLGVPFR